MRPPDCTVAARKDERLTLAGSGPVSDLMWWGVRAGQETTWTQVARDGVDAVLSLAPAEQTRGSLTDGAVSCAAAIRTALGNVGGLAACRYRDGLRLLDSRVDEIAHRRLRTARTRLGRKIQPTRREFSWQNGLAGIGAYLLQRERPARDAVLRALLEYLVALTQPVTHDGQTRPGWWLRGDQVSPRGGIDLGIAEGCAGVLALLAFASSKGIRVPGHLEAMQALVGLYRRHQQRDADGIPWWPLRVDRTEPHPPDLLTDRPDSSWAGTLGIARALQLAGLVLADPGLCRDAVDAAVAALDEAVFCSGGLRSGPHGAAITALRMARDDRGDTGLAAAVDALACSACPLIGTAVEDGGFLDGSAGLLASRLPNRFRPVLPGPSAVPWDWLLLTTC